MQLEGHVAGQGLGAARQRSVQNLHAVFQRLEESFFLGLEHLGDAFFVRSKARISLTHQLHQVGHQSMEKRCLLAQFVAVANGSADDAPLHITSAFIAGNHPVADQKRSGANVVCNHP